MKTISNVIAILLMLGLLLGIGWIGYITVTFLISQFHMVDPETSAILTISAVTFLLSAVIIAASIRSLGKSQEKRRHPRKLELYSQLVEALSNRGQEKSESLLALKTDLVIWGSNSVLEEFENYLELRQHTDPNTAEISKQVQKIISAIRQDVREKNDSIENLDFTKLLYS